MLRFVRLGVCLIEWLCKVLGATANQTYQQVGALRFRTMHYGQYGSHHSWQYGALRFRSA